MRSALAAFTLVVALLSAGCATAPKTPIPDAAAAVVAATDDQILLGKNRAEVIVSRWSDEDKAGFVKRASPLLAVRTLGLTAEQSASLGPRLPAGAAAACVILWDVKAEKIVGSQCYVVAAIPERNQVVRFAEHTAQYVGSL